MTGRAHVASFFASYESSRRARTVAASLAQEIGQIAGDRSGTSLHRDGATLVVRVEADDLVALRAATNTWLSLVGVAERAFSIGASVDG